MSTEYVRTDRSGHAVVVSAKGAGHKYYEDSYAMFSRSKPVVAKGGAEKGELYAVFDGISSLFKGREAAEHMSSMLLEFYRTDLSVVEVLAKGNEEVCGWGYQQGGCAGTVLWIRQGTATVYHLGDTQAMLFREDRGTALTAPHAAGSTLLRYFGQNQVLRMDVVSLQVEEGDRFLLTSDGISAPYTPDPRLLVDRAIKAGAKDDMTAMVVAYEGEFTE